MSAAPLLVGCAFHDGADIDACGCPALDSPGAIAYRGLLVKARAEIARLAAELARVTECYSESHAAVDAGREIDRQNVAEVNRLAAELAAARAVPADVEAAIAATNYAMDRDEAADKLRAAIARAISDATAAHGTVGGLLATAPVGSIVEYMDADGSAWHQVEFNATMTAHRLRIASWGSWKQRDMPQRELRQPARLVPADQADADPSQRGPLPKGG